MTRLKTFLVVALALVAGLLVTARLSAAVDPVTGIWTGQLLSPEMPGPIDVTMKLGLDTHNVVSGTVSGLPTPADVKAGTFDPKSSAVKLQLGKVGDAKVLLALDGTMKNDKATGTFTGDAGGTFALARKS